MKNRSPGYRLSPNEEARLLKEVQESHRKQRLLQVRQQAKVNAAAVRQAVKQEKSKQIQKLASEIKEEWDQIKEEKLETLQDIYAQNMGSIGKSHEQAAESGPKEENMAIRAHVNHQRARARHVEALQKLRAETAKKEEEERQHIVNRQAAVDMEKMRAADVAAMPPPPVDPINFVEVPKVRPVRFTDVDAFSSTYLHVPEMCHVEKAQPQEQTDARNSAKSEAEKMEDLDIEKKRSLHEQQEKARLRHKHALKKEVLKHEYDNMLHDLSDLQRADMNRRQQVVAKIPKQIFLPPHRRIEEKAETQRDMEQAFEDMYMAATEFMGDLSMALDPQPPPETPTATETLDLSVMDDPAETSTFTEQPEKPSRALRDTTNTQQQKPSSPHPSKTPEGLHRLLSRIKTQRNNWLQKSTTSGPERELDQPSKKPPRVSDVSTAPTLSQYTISSEETPSLTTGELDTQSEITVSSKLSTTVSSQQTTTTEETCSTATQDLSEGTLTSTEASQTLLHPLEQAAMFRQRPPSKDHLTAYIQDMKQKQAAMEKSTDLVRTEARDYQLILEQKKAELAHRLAEIEAQRTELRSRLNSGFKFDEH